MDRNGIILAGLAAGGENATFTPVQVQKLFFLLDREASAFTGGPHFNFTPYDYGPFDRSVYDVLEGLASLGYSEVLSGARYKVYRLTQTGFHEGRRQLAAVPENGRGYITAAANWVRRLTFEQLVSEIYKAYPEMKAKSVFRT